MKVLISGGGVAGLMPAYRPRRRPPTTPLLDKILQGPGLVVQSLMRRLIMREAFAPVLHRQFGASSMLPPQNPGPAKE